MSYFRRFIKTQFIWRNLNRYLEEKSKTIQCMLKEQIGEIEGFEQEKPPGCIYRIWLAMQTEATSEHFAWLGFKGFTGGVLLSFVAFLFSTIALRTSLHLATWWCSAIAVFLCFGLAFSSIVRCYTLMILPQLFSKRGRQALTAYTFVLALTGPAINSTHNLGIMADSLACTQDRLKMMMNQIVEMVRTPLLALKETLKKLVADTKNAVKPVRDAVIRFASLMKSVLSVIEEVTNWLRNIADICNNEFGSPFQRCVISFDEAVADCQAKLGPFDFLCSIVTGVKSLCHIAKTADLLCMVDDLVSDLVVAPVKRKLIAFRQKMKDMFAVSIEIDHSLDIKTETSKSIRSIVDNVLNEIDDRTKILQSVFSISIAVPFLAFFLVILRLMMYRNKFLTSDSFDNKYISRLLLDIDFIRLKQGKETVLPLTLKERHHYTTMNSFKMVKGEQLKLITGAVVLMVVTIQIASYIIYDQVIYWTLILIRKQGQVNAYSEEVSSVNVEVEGNGALADLYRRLGESFQPPPQNIDLDPLPCLPDPETPDWNIYIQIGFLVVICWVMSLTEPYGLRMRNVVMSYYYPSRARQRALWLHNHILTTRGSLLHFIRKQFRQNQNEQKIHLWQRILHRNRLLQLFFGTKQKFCSSCGSKEGKSDRFALCPRPGCFGRFCPVCLFIIRSCPLCQELIEVDAELSDYNPERDSSEDEEQQLSMKEYNKRK